MGNSLKALLMCGGRGKRLGMGEKPLVKIKGKPLIDYALDTLSVCEEVICVASPLTPETAAYLSSQGLEVFMAPGDGFIEDMRLAIETLSITEPVVVMSSDVVLLESILEDVISFYYSCESEAVALYSNGESGEKPVGINILDGFFIDREQSQSIFYISENEYVNVNTPDDLKRAEMMLDG
jgi:adenosylcobinamide-phosphate guanylyltransferase